MNSRTEGYEFHPAANIFPLLSDQQLVALGEDIKAHGQHEDIVLFDGKILDGRNRYLACQKAKIEPSYVDLEDCCDPVAYVIGANLHRRQLKTSQRAVCAARVAGLPRGGHNAKSKGPNDPLPASGAAGLFAVGEKSVDRALEVLREGCAEVIRLCELGELAVSAACKLIAQSDSKRDQAKIAKNGATAVREFVSEQRPQRTQPLVELPEKPTDGELFEVERWLEQQDERSFTERFRALWSAADATGKAAIRAIILSESGE